MAKQFSATVQGQSVSFPSSLVKITGTTNGSNIEYLGAIYFADEEVNDLINAANTDGTEQVLATVLRVNDAVQTFPIIMGFPASLISIYPSTLSGSLSVIIYNGDFYYAEESKTALEDAANTSSGGGVTIYTGDGSLTGTDPRNINLNGNSLRAVNGLTTYLDIDIGDDKIQLKNSVNSFLNINGDSDTVALQYKDSTTGITLGGGTSQINYTSNIHTFNVGITITELAGVGNRAIAVDENGKIVLLV